MSVNESVRKHYGSISNLATVAAIVGVVLSDRVGTGLFGLAIVFGSGGLALWAYLTSRSAERSAAHGSPVSTIDESTSVAPSADVRLVDEKLDVLPSWIAIDQVPPWGAVYGSFKVERARSRSLKLFLAHSSLSNSTKWSAGPRLPEIDDEVQEILAVLNRLTREREAQLETYQTFLFEADAENDVLHSGRSHDDPSVPGKVFVH